jgi:hypothetical protein
MSNRQTMPTTSCILPGRTPARVGGGSRPGEVLRHRLPGDAYRVRDPVMLELAALTQPVHRRRRNVEALCDLSNGVLGACQRRPERLFDRGTKGGTKLRDICCGSVRLMRELRTP